MLIELPISLVDDSCGSDVVGKEGMSGHITILIDCIQALYDGGNGNTTLEATNGSVYLILIQYDVMRRIWHKALHMQNGPFLINHVQLTDSNKSEDVSNLTCDGAPACSICGGYNFETKKLGDNLNIKQCIDCGSTIDSK